MNTLVTTVEKENIETITDKLTVIKDAILKTVAAKCIYLFGSYAYGVPTAESDIDIYAVIPDGCDSVFRLLGEVRGILFEQNISKVDLFLVEESRFNMYKIESSFEETICNKGKIIYEN